MRCASQIGTHTHSKIPRGIIELWSLPMLRFDKVTGSSFFKSQVLTPRGFLCFDRLQYPFRACRLVVLRSLSPYVYLYTRDACRASLPATTTADTTTIQLLTRRCKRRRLTVQETDTDRQSLLETALSVKLPCCMPHCHLFRTLGNLKATS